MDKFLQIYGTLPRAGPGSNELTRRAFSMMSDLPESPRILDIGCGPGMQTVELLKLSKGSVVAVDLFPEMIARLQGEAEAAGVSDRLITLVQDMNELEFPESGFDAIWSEGAIYIMGFEEGLEKFRHFVKPGGYIAVSDAVWLRPSPPPEVARFWDEYPEIDDIDAKLGIIERLGYEAVGHFAMPPNAWTDSYYDPMEKRIAEKEKEWKGDQEAETILKEAKNEISIFRRYSDYYSYAFFVMRN